MISKRYAFAKETATSAKTMNLNIVVLQELPANNGPGTVMACVIFCVGISTFYYKVLLVNERRKGVFFIVLSNSYVSLWHFSRGEPIVTTI